MIPERKPRTFLDPVVLSRLAALPLFARKPMQGSVSGRHSSPHRGSSVEFAEYRKYVPGDDLRRLDWRAYGRSDRYLHQGIRGRHQPPLLPGGRHQRVDGLRLGEHHQDRVRPEDRRRAWHPGAPAGGRDRPGLRGQRGGPQHPTSTQPGAPDGDLRRPRECQAQGRDAPRLGAPRAGRDDPPAGPDRDPLRPLRRTRATPGLLWNTCGSASTTSRCSTCSTPES